MNYEKIIKLSIKLQTHQDQVNLCYRIIGAGELTTEADASIRRVIDDLQAEILKMEKTLKVYVGK